MPATLTYSPPTPQNSAECLRTNTRRYARYAEPHPVPPLKGHRETRTASVSYRALSPDGERQNCPVKALPNPHSISATPPPFRHTPFRPRPRHTAPVWRNPGQHPHRDGTFTFSAKERDPETGLSYFGSRYYSSDLSIWLSVDPMAHKYPSLSPYVYCADNPVKLVDPNGEDIWEIDEEGRFVNHYESTTKNDIVYIVDKDGNRIEGQFVVLDYHSIEKQKTISFSPDGKKTDTYDMFQVRGDDNGKKLFEFMAQAVSDAGIEVTHIQCGIEGEKGLNFISCAHERPTTEVINGNSYTISSEKSGWYLFESRLKYGYTIRTWNHSHPKSMEASLSDLSLKNAATKILQQLGRKCPQFNIYHVPSKTPIPY